MVLLDLKKIHSYLTEKKEDALYRFNCSINMGESEYEINKSFNSLLRIVKQVEHIEYCIVMYNVM